MTTNPKSRLAPLNQIVNFSLTMASFAFLALTLTTCQPANAISASELPAWVEAEALRETSRTIVVDPAAIPKDSTFVCDTVATTTGVRESCYWKSNTVECKSPLVKVCVRRYGTRTCGCYPE